MEQKGENGTEIQQTIKSGKSTIGTLNLKPCFFQGITVNKIHRWTLMLLGLSFCPNPNMDWLQLELDLHQFFRRINCVFGLMKNFQFHLMILWVNRFFCLRDYDLNVKSDFMPMVNNLSIDAFIDLVKTYIGIFRKNEWTFLFNTLIYAGHTERDLRFMLLEQILTPQWGGDKFAIFQK